MYNEETLENLKKRILDLAIAGKLVPQDPNDEPASVLIEKIKKEKEKLIKEGKIKKQKEDSFIFKGSDNLYYENVNKKIKCINDEIPFEIPENWAWCRLSSICEIYTGNSINKNIKKTKYSNLKDGINYIGTKDIDNDGNVNYNNGIKIPRNENKFKHANKNSVLMCIEGGSAGKKICIVSEQVCFVNKLCCFYSNSINNNYIYYYLQSRSFNQIFNNKMSGIIGGVNLEIIKHLLIPIPPLSEQGNIVVEINNLISNINKIKVEFSNILKSKEKIKYKVLDDIFNNSSHKSYYANDFKLGDILKYDQPGPYRVKSINYNNNFVTPVLTPGKTFILGYTNEKDGIYKANKDNKVIIFDDFTTATRIVDFDFKVKSSAMKILHLSNKSSFDIDYMFYLLQTININVDTHKRFWISEYAPLKIKVHTFEEQVKIKNKIKNIFKAIDNL